MASNTLSHIEKPSDINSFVDLQRYLLSKPFLIMEEN